MFKKLGSLVLCCSIASLSLAYQKNVGNGSFQSLDTPSKSSEIGYGLSTIEREIQELYRLHAKECAPEDLAFAESYIESYKGLRFKDKKVQVLEIDKLIFLEKAQVYVSLAKDKIYSDVDKDGKPCYQEVAEGTNPLIPDQKVETKKPVKQTVEPKKQNVKPKKVATKKEFKPLKIQARVHFEFDKANIKREYLPYLNVIVRYLKNNPKLLVKIIGYTDSIGTKSYNDKLAMRRAKAVKNYLVKHGISPKRIEILGKGKADYLFDNKNPLNRFTNRRADFFIMKPVENKGA